MPAPDSLTEREFRVLEAVIQTYIETAEPAGSQTIARRFGLGVSSATIRSTMSELEERGYLFHPHTSAGRIPTDRALSLVRGQPDAPCAPQPRPAGGAPDRDAVASFDDRGDRAAGRPGARGADPGARSRGRARLRRSRARAAGADAGGQRPAAPGLHAEERCGPDHLRRGAGHRGGRRAGAGDADAERAPGRPLAPGHPPLARRSAA